KSMTRDTGHNGLVQSKIGRVIRTALGAVFSSQLGISEAIVSPAFENQDMEQHRAKTQPNMRMSSPVCQGSRLAVLAFQRRCSEYSSLTRASWGSLSTSALV